MRTVTSMSTYLIPYALLTSLVCADPHYHCVDLTGIANLHYQDYYAGAENLPTGDIDLGGVPFCIPDGSNGWTSSQGSGTVFVDIPVNLMNIREVHTLINTSWGEVGPYTKLEFYGDQGAYYAKNLYGNSDIRDWLNNVYINSINNTTTINVWSGTAVTSQTGKACRIDKQMIILPAAFANQILTHVRLSDWGDTNLHRAFLSGMTVGQEPCIYCNLALDDVIDFNDFAIFAGSWLEENCAQPQDSCYLADFDEDGTVGPLDLATLADCWLETMPLWFELQYHCVDLTGIANFHYQNNYAGAENLPTGDVELGGVPFCIPEGNNGWNSSLGSGTFSVDIPVNLTSIREVHTLINTGWGQVGPYTKLEFYGDQGAYYAKDLYGNSDIRDWLNGGWINSINNTTTINVWSGTTVTSPAGQACRIDKQMILLPIEFSGQILTHVRMSDWGGANLHRAFLSGMTVGQELYTY
ncbi:MAG: hypothetical protein JXA82_12160 [Sedimentisphaerales bacterium]|nr:hypothetical protein [Sedimentisphaerales bacterium]